MEYLTFDTWDFLKLEIMFWLFIIMYLFEFKNLNQVVIYQYLLRITVSFYYIL